MTDDPLAYTVQSHTLHHDKVGVSQVTSRAFLENARFQVTEDMMRDALVAKLTTYVMSEHLAADTVTESTKVPDSWWDHIKLDLERWADRKPCRILTRWWTRHHPPQFRTVTLTATWTRNATRPESTLKVRDLGPVVYQEQVTSGLWGDETEP